MRDRADHRRLDAGAAVRDALRGLPGAWRGAWAVLTAFSLVISAPLWPLLAAPTWLHLILTSVVGLMAWGALNRVALNHDKDLGAGGVQFGAGELRIAWGLILNLIFLSMIVVVAALAVLAVFGAAGLDSDAVRQHRFMDAGPAWTLAVMAAVGLAAVSAPLLLAVRLSLFAPATIGRGVTVALNSMGIASGALWPLAGLNFLILAGWLAPLLIALRLGLDPCAVTLGIAVVLPWLWAPLATGMLASAYRQLEYWP